MSVRPHHEVPVSLWESSVQVGCDCGWRYSTTRGAADKTEMAAEACEALRIHLEKDPAHQGPVLAICNRCAGRTWFVNEVGNRCRWPDFHGNRCSGTFEPTQQRSGTTKGESHG